MQFLKLIDDSPKGGMIADGIPEFVCFQFPDLHPQRLVLYGFKHLDTFVLHFLEPLATELLYQRLYDLLLGGKQLKRRDLVTG